MSGCVIIPARFKSSRFPGKPLAKIQDKEMIIYVAELSSKALGKDNVFIATDDQRIIDICAYYGFKCFMTSDHALTGTDRIAEIANDLDYDFIINVQGDEPLVDPDDIAKCLELKEKYPDFVINGYAPIVSWDEFISHNIPKVIFDNEYNLIYMSRSPIPSDKKKRKVFQGCNKQVCIYGFNKDDLRFITNTRTKYFLESREDIEILRFIERNRKVKMFKCKAGTISVDTPEDLLRVTNFLNENN